MFRERKRGRESLNSVGSIFFVFRLVFFIPVGGIVEYLFQDKYFPYNSHMKKIFLVLAASFIPFIASAHDGGLSMEKLTQDYFFDIGYSSEFVANDFIRFNLSLFSADKKREVPFTNAWVRITKGDETVFAGPIAHDNFGKSGFSFAFSSAGDYSLSVRFEDGGSSLAQETFSIKVSSAKSDSSARSWIAKAPYFLIGLAVGSAAVKFSGKNA